MTLSFELPKNKSNAIKVIGVGGGGSNAVEYMFNQRIEGVDFVICNTDEQALNNSPVPLKLALGTKVTNGMGAGSNPEKGYEAAKESEESIREILSVNTKMVFITAGMGGGTGTGAAPVIARISKELGLLTVGIVTMPFDFEGEKRIKDARNGIKNLREYVDALIVINNNKLIKIYGDLGYRAGFAKADEVLATAAKGIAQVITHHYKRNIDLNDAKTVLANSGNAIMGSATASGEGRAKKVITEALHSPLLNDNRIKGATRVLLLIVSGEKEATFNEINEINQHIRRQAGKKVNIILGMGDDPELGEAISVTVIATGFPGGQQEDMNVDEKEKVVHVLNEEQPMQFDLFSAPMDEPMNTPFEQTSIEEERIVHQLEEESSDEKPDTPVQATLFTPDEVMDIEVEFTEISDKIEEVNSISDTNDKEGEIDYLSEELLNMEIECEEVILSASSYDQTGDSNQKNNRRERKQMELNFDLADNSGEEKKIVHQLTQDETHPDNQLASPEAGVEVEEEQYKVFKKQNVNEQEMQAPIEEEEKYTPMNMTIKEFKETSDNRKKTWKKMYNYDFITPMYGNVENLENEPAYKRKGLDIEQNPSNEDSEISRTSLEIGENGDIQLRSNNSFLHDNVD